jgi:hypothetical protein
MRLSGFVVAANLLLSVTLMAQHSTGGGSSHGGSSGASSSFSAHGGFSGGSGASVSNHNSGSSASHAGGTSPSPSSKASSKENASPEKKNSHSFLHPFRKASPVQRAAFKHPAPCLKGRPCPCPTGGSHFGGACVPANNGCQAGQSWNGLTCGVPYWSNDCNALAEQLAAQREQMQGQSDYGQSLRLRMLQQQYQQCLSRFGSYQFSALLLDTP